MARRRKRKQPEQDRERVTHQLSAHARIKISRSSAHPVRYAVRLEVLRGEWQTIRLCDNSHDDVDEMHEHRYIGTTKQDPAKRRCDPNEAMHSAEDMLYRHWRAIVADWEKTL